MMPLRFSLFYGIFGLIYLDFIFELANPLKALLKSLPIFLLVLVVWLQKMPQRQQYLLTCILFCFALGDILLTMPGDTMLQSGIAAFLLAHIGYIIVMLPLFKWQSTRIYLFSPVLLLTFLLGFWLFPYLNELTIPVLVYISVILSMVFVAVQVN